MRNFSLVFLGPLVFNPWAAKLSHSKLCLGQLCCWVHQVRRTVAQSFTKTAKNPQIIFLEIYHFYYVFCFPVMWDDLPKHF